MEQKLFENEIREKCKELLLKGDLQRVIAAKEFLGKTDYEFGLFLTPLFVKEEKEDLVLPEKTPSKLYHTIEDTYNELKQKKEKFRRQKGTVLLKSGYYEIVNNGKQIHEGSIGEYKTLNFEHGNIVSFIKPANFLEDINIEGMDTTAPKLNLMKHAIVERDSNTGALCIRKDFNGVTLIEHGGAYPTLYLRGLAHKKQISEGDIVDLFIQEDGYPYINWVYRDIDEEKTLEKPNFSPSKKQWTEKKDSEQLDFDLKGKIVTIVGLPMTLLPRIKDVILNSKKAKDLRVIETGVKIAGFEHKLPKAISDSNVIVIAKTGISHGMSELIVSEAKKRGIPFAYANQPSLLRMEMALYRAINNLAVDEISSGNIEYPQKIKNNIDNITYK